jgi:hypothetical protein
MQNRPEAGLLGGDSEPPSSDSDTPTVHARHGKSALPLSALTAAPARMKMRSVGEWMKKPCPQSLIHNLA